jgi:uncharacterized protein YjiS (DUF1127 family)
MQHVRDLTRATEPAACMAAIAGAVARLGELRRRECELETARVRLEADIGVGRSELDLQAFRAEVRAEEAEARAADAEECLAQVRRAVVVLGQRSSPPA